MVGLLPCKNGRPKTVGLNARLGDWVHSHQAFHPGLARATGRSPHPGGAPSLGEKPNGCAALRCIVRLVRLSWVGRCGMVGRPSVRRPLRQAAARGSLRQDQTHVGFSSALSGRSPASSGRISTFYWGRHDSVLPTELSVLDGLQSIQFLGLMQPRLGGVTTSRSGAVAGGWCLQQPVLA